MRVFPTSRMDFFILSFFILSLKFDVVKVAFFHSSFEPFSLRKEKKQRNNLEKSGHFTYICK